MKCIIKNTTLVTQNSQRDILKDYDIILDDGIIEAIVPSSSIADYADCEVIDGSEFYLLPGFINTHIHLGESIYKDAFHGKFSLEDYLLKTEQFSQNAYFFIENKRDDVAQYSIKESLKSGATLICGGRLFPHIDQIGVRAFSFYMVMNSKKLKDYTSDYYEKARKCIVDGEANGIFLHSLNNVDLDHLTITKRLMDEYPHIKLSIHIGETMVQESQIKQIFKMGSIDLLDQYGLLNDKVLLVHCGNLSEHELAIIEERGAHIIHCLKSNLNVGDRTIALSDIVHRGINVSIATDGLITSGGLSIIDEANVNFTYHNRFSKEDVSYQLILDMLTINPALALGLSNLLGSLEVGKMADILFFKKNNEKYSIQNIIYYKDKPFAVMIDGIFKIRNYDLSNNVESDINQKFFNTLDKFNEDYLS